MGGTPGDSACSFIRGSNLTAPLIYSRLTSRIGKNRTLGNENGSEGSKFPAFHPPVLPPNVIAGRGHYQRETTGPITLVLEAPVAHLT